MTTGWGAAKIIHNHGRTKNSLRSQRKNEQTKDYSTIEGEPTMARRKVQKLDLADVFQAVSGNLVQKQTSLNQADEYNHNHGDNMVEIFGAINEAVEAKRGKKPSTQLAYASELVGKRSQSGSAKLYASGLAKASKQFRGKSLTPDMISTLLGSLFGGAAGGQAPVQPSSGGAGDLLGGLLGGMASGQGAGNQAPGLPTDLLGSLLGGGGGAPVQESTGATGDLLGSLLSGAGGQGGGSQPGLDMGDIISGGMAFMQSQQQGESTVQAIIKAFVAATQVGQSSHRAQSGELVANSILQLFGGRGGR
jgi:hypothetical protein